MLLIFFYNCIEKLSNKLKRINLICFEISLNYSSAWVMNNRNKLIFEKQLMNDDPCVEMQGLLKERPGPVVQTKITYTRRNQWVMNHAMCGPQSKTTLLDQ